MNMIFEVEDLAVASPATQRVPLRNGVRRAGDHRVVATAALTDGDAAG